MYVFAVLFLFVLTVGASSLLVYLCEKSCHEKNGEPFKIRNPQEYIITVLIVAAIFLNLMFLRMSLVSESTESERCCSCHCEIIEES